LIVCSAKININLNYIKIMLNSLLEVCKTRFTKFKQHSERYYEKYK
jgi:hypothetical protein